MVVASLRDRRAVWPRWAVAALVVALLLRVAFVAATPHYVPTHDDAQYDRLACAIVTDGSYPRLGPATTPTSCGAPHPGAAPTAFRPPGYPALLAGVYAVTAPITDDRWTAARLVQAALGTGLVALIGVVAAQLWGRSAGLAALALAAVFPPLIVVGGSLLSETLAVTLLVAALAAALAARRRGGWGWVAVAGVLLGLSTLTRPQGALLALPLVLAVWPSGASGGRALGRPALLLAAAALTIAPWTARNAVQLGAFVPVSTHTGSALAGTYNDVARARTDHPAAWLWPRRVAAFDDVGDDEVTGQAELRRRALAYAADRPAYVAEVAIRNTLRLANLHGRGWWVTSARAMSLPPAAGDLSTAGFLIVVPLALVGACTAAARRAPWWLWLAPALLLVSAVVLAGETRLRAPLDPFLLLLAALGVLAVGRRLRGRGPAADPPARPLDAGRTVPPPVSDREPAACVWCGRPFDRTSKRRTGRLVCAACGAATTAPWPTEAELERAYGRAYRPAEGRFGGPGDALLRWSRGWLARRLDLIAPSGPVLDVGCGDGALLAALRRRGRVAVGLERGSTSLDGVRTGSVADQPPGWAAIVLWHSLEHLPDPATTLQAAAERLRPDGVLVVAIPNADSVQARAFGDRWFALDLPRHLIHLPAGALLERLRSIGLRIERVSFGRGGQIVFGWLHGLVGLLPGRPSLYDAVRRPAARAQPLTMPRPLVLAAAVVLLPVAALAGVGEVALRRGGTCYVEARRG